MTGSFNININKYLTHFHSNIALKIVQPISETNCITTTSQFPSLILPPKHQTHTTVQQATTTPAVRASNI